MLRRDGEEVGQQTVELEPGDNEVRFEDTPGADAGAVMRYQATVTAPRNTVAENDVGYGAVAVEGPARVLVVEGAPGEAETLVAALNAGGVGTEVIGVGDIPDVQELITYAGIVMVDVDARTLTGDQIDHITTAVRDLGRGLVTIGGERSYGVGGYLESPLNDLLPVDSEIVDPLRRRTVAEVLSIDTSESMGACHCAGEAMGNAPAEGGINKTDISRAAAERTIAALSENDEVGVLAWNSSAEWVIELQTLPPADVIDRGLRSLQPLGQHRHPRLARRRRRGADRERRRAEAHHPVHRRLHGAGRDRGHGGGGRPAVRGARHHGVGAGDRRVARAGRCSRTSPRPATAASTPAPTSRTSRRSWPRKR